MAQEFTKLIILRYDENGVLDTNKSTIPKITAGADGVTLWFEAPFDNATYSGGVAFTLANGQSEYRPFLDAYQIVDDATFYRYTLEVDGTLTTVSATNTGVALLGTPRLTGTVTQPTFAQFSVTVNAGDTTGFTPVEPDPVATLGTTKREKDPRSLNEADLEKTQIITTYESDSLGERQTTIDKIIERAAGTTTADLLPTNVDSTRDDVVLGQKFKKNVQFVTDTDYVTAGAEITLNTVGAGTFENVYSFIAYDGFLSGTRENTNFTTTLEAKKAAGNLGDVDFKLEYKKIDSSDVETMIFDGLPITISTNDFNTSTKSGKITTSTIDYDAGEAFITRLYLKADNAGDGVTFKVGGTNPASFTTFFVSSSSVNANKIDKLQGAVGGKLVESKTDGQLLETDIDATDVALKSDKGVADGYASLDSGGKVPASQLPIDLVEIKGTFGSGASTTGGDVPASAELGNTYICDINGYISPNAGDTFYINDKALWTDSGWIRNAANDSVRTVNSKTPDANANIDIDKNDVGLGNVENTSDLDKPISTATQTALDTKISYINVLDQGVAVGGNQFTKINFASGATLIQDGTDPNQVNVDVVGAGTGEGIIVLGQANTIVPIVVGTSNTPLTFTNYRQSTDLTVFEMFDNADTPQNTIRAYKMGTEIENDPVQYKFFLTGKGTNTNQTQSVVLSFRLFKDGIEVVNSEWPSTATIGEASAQADASNNFTIESFVDTNPLNAQEDYTLQINASATGVTLDKLDIHFTSNFVSGEALSNLMRTDVYDVNKLGRVDKAKGDASGNDIEATYETIANVDTLKGVGWVDETVKGNADDILTKANKEPNINLQTGLTYTLALTDSDKFLEVNNATSCAITVPTNASVAFPIGTQITIVAIGAGAYTVVGDTGVTINGDVAPTKTITAQYDSVALYKRAQDEWIIVGSFS